MPKVLQIAYEGYRHRFVKRLDEPDSGSELVVRVGDQTLRAVRGSLPGRPRFELPDAATEFEVFLRLADPDAKDDPDRDFERVTQKFALVGGATLKPREGLHTRFTLPDGVATQGEAGGAVLTLGLDLTFLDVNQRIEARYQAQWPELQKHYPTPRGPLTERLRAEWTAEAPGVLRTPYRRPAHIWNALTKTFPGKGDEVDGEHRVTMSLFELTTDPFPPAWAAVVPPAARAASGAVNVFLFMCPWDPEKVYRDSDQFKVWNLNRYAVATAYPQTPYYTERISEGPPEQHGFTGWHGVRPSVCSFARQLEASGKPVVLIFPMPGSVNNGPLSMTARNGRTVRAVVASLLRALRASGEWGRARAQTPIAIGRLGVGGFSDGARAAVDMVRANPEAFDVCCLFDPIEATQQAARSLRGWLSQRGVSGQPRALILVPTWLHAGVRDLHASLPDSTMLNGDPAWFARSLAYRRAHTARAPLGFLRQGVTPRTLPARPGAPADEVRYATEADEVSATLGIFLEQESADGTTITLTDGKTSHKLQGVSQHEAGAIAYFLFVKAKKRPQSLASFAQECKSHEPFRQHQWAVVGGEHVPGRGDVGFFQLCLERGGYR